MTLELAGGFSGVCALAGKLLQSSGLLATLGERASTHDLVTVKKMAKNEIPGALRAAYLALHRRCEARFADYGVTADQFVLLATLARGDILTQRELARRMPSDPSTVRAMLVLLERLALVQRDVHPTDSRARSVSLTTAGKRKFRQLWRAGESIRDQMFGSLLPDEAETLVMLLRRIAESLNVACVAVGRSPSLHAQQDET